MTTMTADVAPVTFYPVLSNPSAPALASTATSWSVLYGPSNISANASVLSQRWVPLLVSSIDKVEVQKQLFDDKTILVSGVPVNLKGRVQYAQMKITFGLPYHVTEGQIAVRVSKETTLVSQDMSIDVGLIASANEVDPVSSVLIEQSESPQRFTILVPFVDAMTLLDPHKPMLDYVNAAGPKVIHHTMKIDGVQWPCIAKRCTFRIRTKVSQTDDDISLSSVSSSTVDMPRIKEGWDHFLTFVKGIPRLVRDSWSTAGNNNKPQQPPSSSSSARPTSFQFQQAPSPQTNNNAGNAGDVVIGSLDAPTTAPVSQQPQQLPSAPAFTI